MAEVVTVSSDLHEAVLLECRRHREVLDGLRQRLEAAAGDQKGQHEVSLAMLVEVNNHETNIRALVADG